MGFQILKLVEGTKCLRRGYVAVVAKHPPPKILFGILDLLDAWKSHLQTLSKPHEITYELLVPQQMADGLARGGEN